ncbi:hypothetical protein [Spirosoma pulveris]
MIFVLSACHPSVDPCTACSVAGSYQLITYSSATSSDDNPTGTTIATQVDPQHVTIVVKGNSGKLKLNYTYSNVLVKVSDPTAIPQTSYTLLYKGHPIGEAGSDGISRYLDLTPSSLIRISALEF